MALSSIQYMKFVIYGFNLMFWVAGLGLMIVGSLVRVRFDDYNALMGTSFDAATIMFIATGGLLLVLGFVGCCGAYKENFCMVSTFAVLLIIAVSLEIAAGAAAYAMQRKVNDFAKEQIINGLDQYTTNPDVERTWNTIQFKLKCCGVEAPSDWCQGNVTDVPPSCCNVTQDSVDLQKCGLGQCSVPRPKELHTDGCLPKLAKMIQDNSLIIGGVGVGAAVIQIIGIIMACCLGQAIRKGYQVV